MTAPDTNSALEESAGKDGPAGVGPEGTPAPPDKSSPAAKAKNHNIRVSSAVLDAAAQGRRCTASVAAHDSRGPDASGGRSESADRRPERSCAGTPARLVHAALDHPSQSAGDSAGSSLVDLLCHGRRARRDRDGMHGGAQRHAAIRAGSPRGCGGGQAQSHDPRDRQCLSGWQGVGDAAARSCPWGHHQSARRRHDPRRCAGSLCERPVREPGYAYRRVLSCREVPRSGPQSLQFADRPEEHLLHGDKR